MFRQTPFFISEVSSNHSNDLNRCFDFIDKSASIGCDAVKFQLFKIDKLFSPEVFQKKPEIEKRKKWELPIDFLPELKNRCHINNIQFGVTPFYLDAVDILNPFIDFFKIASYELLWNDLLIACARSGKPIIISTGMATFEEVYNAVDIILKNGCKNLTILHCTSSYPTPIYECNLSSIQTLRDKLNCKIGWSDHSVSPSVIYRAINKWQAEVIEFHIDLDGKGDEFAQGHCWLPDQIRDVIKIIREGFFADGNGFKGPTSSEQNERLWRADPSDGLRPLKQIRNSI